MSSETIALPLAKAKRRKPKPPWFRWKVAWFIVKISFLTFLILDSLRDPSGPVSSAIFIILWFWIVIDDWKIITTWWNREDIPFTKPFKPLTNWDYAFVGIWLVGMSCLVAGI